MNIRSSLCKGYKEFLWSIFCILLENGCFVVALFDPVHVVEAIFHIPLLLTASGNLF